MTFRIGQKVVCIKEGLWKDKCGMPIICSHSPTKGNIYTIVHIITDPNGDAFLVLHECNGDEIYISDAFRPVRTTDISIFEAMLVSPPKQRVAA